jgi:hypothetical protein
MSLSAERERPMRSAFALQRVLTVATAHRGRGGIDRLEPLELRRGSRHNDGGRVPRSSTESGDGGESQAPALGKPWIG